MSGGAFDAERGGLRRPLRHRLVRYGFAGSASFLTHLLVLVGLVEGLALNPVLATTLGFLASIVVSYLLQHRWVFRSVVPVQAAFPRFLLVTAVGLALNSLIMGFGVRVLAQHYLLVQCVAFVAVPVSNYLLNRAWTFAPHRAESTLEPLDWLCLFGASALWLLAAACAVVHLDFARDLMVAQDILDGVAFPSLGPELAGSLHLGPAWYYLLAGLVLFGGFWPVVSLLALLAAAQFWLAHAVVRRMAGAPAARITVALLLVPGWTTFELVLVGHPMLTAACVAALVLAGLRFAESGRTAPLVLMGLAFVIGLHAHPTVLVLAALPLGFALLGVVRHGIHWPGVMLAALVAALPLVPMLVDQWQGGWPILEGWQLFAGHEQSSGRLSAAGPLLWELSGGGPSYWLASIAGWPRLLADAAGAVVALVVLAGLIGAAQRALRGDASMMVLLAALLVGLCGLSLVRSFHPHYMLSGVRTLLLLTAGVGLAGFLERGAVHRLLSASTVLAGPVLLLVGLSTLAVQQRSGSWSFAFLPLMDVTVPRAAHQPHPFLTVRAARASGEWLCANRGRPLHGSYALSVLHSYAAEARLACGASTFRIGGDAPASRPVVGLSGALLERLALEPAVRIGGFGLLPVTGTLNRGAGWSTGPGRPYPPLVPDFEGVERRVVTWPDEGRGLVVVSDLSFGVARPPVLRADCDGVPLEPLARDGLSRVFDAGGCDGGGLTIESAVPDYIDVVVIDRQGPR
jgi:putative flippase GtrA